MKTRLLNYLISLWAKIQAFFKKPSTDLTLVFLTSGHLEVRKIRLSPRGILFLRIGAVCLGAFVALSLSFLIYFVVTIPQRSIIAAENHVLRKEMSNIQYHLDTLQFSLDRVERYDQKLRALTQSKRPNVQEPKTSAEGPTAMPSVFDFGDFQVDASVLNVSERSKQFLDRADTFLLQKIYTWMGRLFWRGELQEQSLEELYEVLRDRDLELTFTPSIMPVNGWITSHFGYRMDPFSGQRTLHKGIDISVPLGAPVVSPADGMVAFQGRYGGYGNAIMIFHGYGISTLYAHLDSVHVKVGQRVKRGDFIATAGSSGRSTAPHLHYEVIVHGVSVDPRKYVLDRSL